MIILFFAAIELDGDETGRRLSFTYPEFIFCFSVFNGYLLYVAVSKTNNKLKSLPKTYQIVLRMLRLAVRADITPMFYDRLEVKKLILAVDDISLLESIYNENLKKLEVYDRDNGTDYMSFLRLYLKYDGSVQRVAQETFVHRNTINYQLAKIKKILGNNLKTFEERFKIILAFEVRDVL